MTSPDLRSIAMTSIDQYRNNSEWSVARQVILQCLTATWVECSTVDRFVRLSEPLTGQHIDGVAVAMQLTKMRKAGLVRRRMIRGILNYELVL